MLNRPNQEEVGTREVLASTRGPLGSQTRIFGVIWSPKRSILHLEEQVCLFFCGSVDGVEYSWLVSNDAFPVIAIEIAEVNII